MALLHGHEFCDDHDADDHDTLGNKRLADLTGDEKKAMCYRDQEAEKRQLRALMEISCTDLARAVEDCPQSRAACFAGLPTIDFDVCESAEAAMRARLLYGMEFLKNVEFFDFASELLQDTVSTFSSSCPLTVQQWRDCFATQVQPRLRAAKAYDCEGGDETLDYPLSEACLVVGRSASLCSSEETQP